MPHVILRIEPAEAKSLVEDGKAVILDVVSPVSWVQMRRYLEEEEYGF